MKMTVYLLALSVALPSVARAQYGELFDAPSWYEEQSRQVEEEQSWRSPVLDELDREAERSRRIQQEMNSHWPAINREACGFIDRNPAARADCFDGLR